MDDIANISPSDEYIEFTQSEISASDTYNRVNYHWFYQADSVNEQWKPFSQLDSTMLESTFESGKSTDVVTTEGGRYDVYLSKRERVPVYWRDNPALVRRCSWFYKNANDPRLIPYSEEIADLLEEEYKQGIITSVWNRKVVLADEEIVLHSSTLMVRLMRASSPDSWSGAFQSKWTVQRGLFGIDVDLGEPRRIADHLLFVVHGIGEPKKRIESPTKDLDQITPLTRAVHRGVDTTDIEEGETIKTDHLLLLIHGIGSVCDFKMRTVEEVVDNFRSIGMQLVQSHFKTSYDKEIISRVEVLPISWHWNLHSDETGIDSRINKITLDSVPIFRSFTNDTLLDVLFYTSPKFCQTIIDTVGNEINRIYSLYISRNPGFKGGVSLGGHSLGSLIVFDLLSHQELPKEESKDFRGSFGAAGTGQLSVKYPQLDFSPDSFFALGSPVGMFVCVRGIESLGEDFKLPTCKNFFNIFHPFDPVAYRIESLINPQLSKLGPFQIPHHKGRKRMHLELKDAVTRVGADLKQKIVDSMRTTWDSIYKFTVSPRQVLLQERVKEVIEEELIKEAEAEKVLEDTSDKSNNVLTESEINLLTFLGKLNGGRRIDYVLQEAPFELFNEYIFAMASHVCYWESEDTMLFILREIYSKLGVETDYQISSSSDEKGINVTPKNE